MAEAATEFGKIKDAVHHVAQDMDATSSSAKHASDALGTVLKTLLVVDITLKGLERASAFSPMARNLKEAFTTLGKSADQLKGIHYAELELADKRFRANEITKEQVKEIADRTQIRYPILQAQLRLEEEMRRVGALRLIILGGILTQTIAAYRANSRLNDDLIKANVGWGARYDLVQENYAIQRQLGVNFGTVIEAQRILINYGVQNNRAYGETLKTVVELHEGLGMSVQAAAELAVITERQIKTSFRDTADVVARLVNETSLTADEVERIAKTLGPLILAIQPRGAPAFPQIAQALGQYEDAVKRLGGMGDEFTQMIGKMLKPEGLLQAGFLGITDPSVLLTKSGFKQGMEMFNKQVDQILGSATGEDRIFRMQMLADMFGTSYEQMSLMVEADKNVNAQMNERITLEQRFRMQMAEAGKSFSQIYNSLTTLIQQALSPVAGWINRFGMFINDWIIQPIMNHRTTLIIAWTAVWAGIIATIVQLRRAFVAFIEVAGAARLAAGQLKQYAAAQLAQTAIGATGHAARDITTGAAGAGIFSKLVSVLRGASTWSVLGETIGLRVGLFFLRLAPLLEAALNPITLLVGGILIWQNEMAKLRIRMYQDQIQSRIRLTDMKQTLLDTAKTQIYMATRAGDQVKAEQVMKTVLADLKRSPGTYDLTPQQAAVEAAKFTNQLKLLVAEAQYTGTQFGTLRMTPAQREAQSKENLEFQQKIADNTKQSLKEAKKAIDEEKRQAEAQRQARELMYLRDGGVVGRQIGVGYGYPM